MKLEHLKKQTIRKDLTGTVRGELEVHEYMGHNGKRSYWRCLCKSCSREIITTFSIKNKISTCRYCYHGLGKDHYAWKGIGDLPKDIYTTYRHGAAARNIDFDVSMEYLWKLYQNQNMTCVLTGWPIEFNKTQRSKTKRTASLDRIDSNKGYAPGNLQWVHRDVNRLKKNMDNGRFIALCHAIAKYTKEPQ